MAPRYLHLGLFICLALASSRVEGASQQDFEACQQVSDLDKSIKACGIIIDDKSESTSDRALMNLHRGYAFFTKGDFAEAIRDFDTSIILGPEDVYAFLNRALALYRIDEKSQAIADYRWANEMDPDNVAAMSASNEDLLKIKEFSLKTETTATYSSVSPDLRKTIARIELHLASHPEDGKGFEVVAPFYVRLGRDRDALHARREALRLLGPNTQREVDYGEILTVVNHGRVVEEAQSAFEHALALEPQVPAARYYLGLAFAQRGDKQRARAAWTLLLKDAPEDAQYRALVQSQLTDIDAEGQ